MINKNELEILRQGLPGQVFYAFSSILDARLYLEAEDYKNLVCIDALFDFLDRHGSVVFNHINDIIFFNSKARELITESANKQSQYYLYLRDFWFTNEELNFADSAKSSSWSIMYNLAGQGVMNAISELNTSGYQFLTIHNPKGANERWSTYSDILLPSLILPESEWRKTVKELIRSAQGIILHLGVLGEGSQFEIDCIRALNKQDKCLIVFENANHESSGQNFVDQINDITKLNIKEDSSVEKSSLFSSKQKLIREFRNSMDFNQKFEISGKIELIEKIKLLGNDSGEINSSTLLDIATKEIVLETVLSESIVRVLKKILRKNREFLDQQKNIAVIQLLYIEASVLCMLGRFNSCYEIYLSIAVYAYLHLEGYPELKSRVITSNLGRASACIYWSGIVENPEDARKKTINVFEQTLSKLE